LWIAKIVGLAKVGMLSIAERVGKLERDFKNN